MARYVNPLQGTDSVRSLSIGNPLPMIARPFAMTDWTLQTDGWFFSPDARVLQGVRHAPAQPIDGRLRLFHRDGPDGKTLLEGGTTHLTLPYRPDESTITPHYLRVPLRCYSLLLEMTLTERCSVFRFTFPKGETGRVLVQIEGTSQVKIDREKSLISGFTRTKSDGVPDNFACYFVARFDRAWRGARIALEDKVDGKATQLDGKNGWGLPAKLPRGWLDGAVAQPWRQLQHGRHPRRCRHCRRRR